MDVHRFTSLLAWARDSTDPAGRAIVLAEALALVAGPGDPGTSAAPAPRQNRTRARASGHVMRARPPRETVSADRWAAVTPAAHRPPPAACLLSTRSSEVMLVRPMPEDWDRAVAVVAHPDDLEYGAASAIARWTGQGREVSYVIATSGEAGIDGLAPERARPLREAEQRRGAEVVGVRHVEFLGHPDGLVEYGTALRRDIAGALRRLRPEVVITMNFDLTWGGPAGPVNHADHRNTGLATVDACRDAANRWLFPELGEPWQGLRGCYVAGIDNPTHFVDVTNTLDRAVASLRAHQAYLDGLGGDFDPARFLHDTALAAGQVAGCELAVLFGQLALD